MTALSLIFHHHTAANTLFMPVSDQKNNEEVPFYTHLAMEGRVLLTNDYPGPEPLSESKQGTFSSV
jgi:hypothetical protein